MEKIRPAMTDEEWIAEELADRLALELRAEDRPEHFACCFERNDGHCDMSAHIEGTITIRGRRDDGYGGTGRLEVTGAELRVTDCEVVVYDEEDGIALRRSPDKDGISDMCLELMGY